MNHELRLLHSRASRIDFVDSDLQRAGYILVGCLIEANMTVADLHEREVLNDLLLSRICRVGQQLGSRHARNERPDEPRARPCHALQEVPPVDAISST